MVGICFAVSPKATSLKSLGNLFMHSALKLLENDQICSYLLLVKISYLP